MKYDKTSSDYSEDIEISELKELSTEPYHEMKVKVSDELLGELDEYAYMTLIDKITNKLMETTFNNIKDKLDYPKIIEAVQNAIIRDLTIEQLRTELNYKGKIGFISPISNCFCNECNRIRLTSNGFLKKCLHYNYGVDLKKYIRSNISNKDLKDLIYNNIYDKPQKHLFMEECDDKENKYMNQIGG